MALNRHSGLPQAADREVTLRHGVSHADVLRAYVGLLSLGKSDFNALENFREDGFFAEALGIGTMPSAVTVRQRLDARGEAFLPLVTRSAVEFLVGVKAKVTALETGHVALDADVIPFDNSNSRKEGLSRTTTNARQRIEGRWPKRVENQATRACGIGNLTQSRGFHNSLYGWD